MLQFLFTICDEQYHSRIEYIYKRFHKDMFRFARNRFIAMNSHNPELDAEDAVQRAYLRITKYIHNLRFPMQWTGYAPSVQTELPAPTISIPSSY